MKNIKSSLNISRLTIIINILLLPIQSTIAQRAALIGKNTAIFYPANYNKNAHQPSFALLKEPSETGQLPHTWKTKVIFGQNFGKSMAIIPIEEGTDLYGTGEVTGSLVRNGTVRKLWNTDNVAYKKDNGQRLYQSHPWVLGVRKDGTAFGVLADNTWRQEIVLGEHIQFISDAPPFRVIVIERETPQEVVQVLGELTGKIPLPPLWSLGYQQCRWSYYPDSRVKEIADTFRIKQIPCDVIWMDIHYMDQYKIFTFSPERFPNPAETNDYLHEKGFKSVWMIDPGVKKEVGYKVYDSGTKRDVWVKDKNENSYTGKVWPGDCVFPDFTQPKTRKWWAGLYKDFMANGIDGIWNDMNEPSVFDGPDNTMPIDNLHDGGNGIPSGIHLRYHNIYGMMMVKASREGILASNPNKRPFVLTRSNFLGGQRYAATWTGDNLSTFKYLKMSIPMSLNLGLSGQPFSGPDIGGFGQNATPELFGQWIAVGAFYPFSRDHSAFGTRNQEPWAFGQKIEMVSHTALQRRYRLLPYLYTLFHEASVNGMPVMRPVFFADPKDLNLRTEDQAFLLGSDLLVIPRWAENPSLPKGNWRKISLVKNENDGYQADLRLKEGAILPVGKIIQNTTEYSLDTLTLYVSLNDDGKATGSLYQDAGDGFAYQNGDYALVTFHARKSGNKVIIEKTKQEGNYQLNNKIIKIQLITDDKNITKEVKGSMPIEINLNEENTE